MRDRGYAGVNPWHSAANSAEGESGEPLSGWYMRYAHLPARVKEEHSETAYTTNRAMDFITEAGDQPWCLHLSYIKPHWPYMAPAPYHALYGPEDILPAVRSDAERERPHPVVEAFMGHGESSEFARDEVRERVIPAYMGLITQLDDHLGRLVDFLEAKGLRENTVIVVTSDHGDYLGDHWLGEKELFHEPSARIPLIVVDPRRDADATRGSRNDQLVEAIDLVPTFVDYAGGNSQALNHVLEGRSLHGLVTRGPAETWRRYAFSEADYAWRPARKELGLAPDEARAFMVTDGRWKYVHYANHPPQLFDLATDPGELEDLAHRDGCRTVRGELEAALNDWFKARRLRTTIGNDEVERRTGTARKRGILYGIW
ncbi:sulfatase-like hydrolase/transferase [Halomonas mongoliensis]|uniref:sulfatase-like hydrolase/transferase n=1 Tax=Halomonas mongoliensis TaxID=321265 RepID=UPI00403AAE1B